MKPYIYIAKLKIQSVLAYRFDVFSSIILQTIVMFAVSYFWIAVYGNMTSTEGVTKDSMLIYTIISTLMSSLLIAEVEDRIIRSVRTGSIATDMIKPVSLFGTYLAEDLGAVIVTFFQKTLPLLIIGSLFIHSLVPASGIQLILFLCSFTLSYVINWIFSAVFGMWIFSAISMGPMSSVKGHIIRLLSGSIIPIWFFPKWLENILNLLPFTYMYQLPLGIYIGKYHGETALTRIGIQVLWVGILLMTFFILHRKIMNKVLVQGG